MVLTLTWWGSLKSWGPGQLQHWPLDKLALHEADFFEKLTITQQIKIFPDLYGMQKFIALFTYSLPLDSASSQVNPVYTFTRLSLRSVSRNIHPI
jgi:hypothetical protein